METPAAQYPADAADRIVDHLIQYLETLKEDGVAEIELSRESIAPLMMMTSSPSDAKSTAMPVVPEPRGPARTDDSAVKTELAAITSQIAACTRCSLHRARTKTVPGQGHARPEILFVGEGPGADEDLQGLAFVGRAGQLLTRLITRMGYRREEVFIANVVKCRPPENRKPLPDEMEACLPFLKAQVAVLKPKVMVALGATALEGLIPTQGKIFITRMRGKWLSYENIPLMPTFHPSYLLRNESAMWDVWNDMQEVLKHLGRTPPPRKS